jgi:dolichol-phosphate mannosyltransferase
VDDADAHAIAGRGAGDERDAAVAVAVAADAVAAGGERVDDEVELLALHAGRTGAGARRADSMVSAIRTRRDRTAAATATAAANASMVGVMARALIVVPTYNERDNVRGAAERLLEAAPVDLLIVDDNSPDGTGAIADELAAADPRIHVIHRAGKLGLGTAYVAGFTWGLARDYELLFEMDADGSHDPKYLADMLALADDGADVVVGSRYVPGGGTENWGFGRRLISQGGSLYARTILSIDVADVTAGFVCWRRRALQALDLTTVTSNGYSFQIEMKYRALQAGMRVVETPIVFVDRRVGQSKMSRAIFVEALLKVWALRFGGRR